MRNYKFRGKRVDNGEWVFGDLINTDTKIYIAGGEMWATEFDLATKSIELEVAEVHPESVGQFSGFKDCKGIDIFADDILGDWTDVDGKMEQSRQTVFFDEECGQWGLDYGTVQNRESWFALFDELKSFDYEIIGNIHDNPELLKQ